MDKERLITQMQVYLDGGAEPEIEIHPDMDVKQAFFCRTAKRLQVAFQLQVQNPEYTDDFYLALRDFLLVFETGLSVRTVEMSKIQSYAIRQEEETGIYYCSLQFPDGVNTVLAEQAFLRNIPSGGRRKKEYNLLTDPWIYALTGFQRFKSMAQKLSVYGALHTPEGYTALVSLPTGGGKSLVTQMLGYQEEGLTIVVVPTVSLADDQLIAARQLIKREHADQEIFTYRSGVTIAPVLQAIEKKTARLLFISPEALLNNQAFEDVIQTANRQRYLKNIVIDEAHIVVDWGASFRVEFQCLEAWRKKLMLNNPAIRTILLSATFENSCIQVLKKLFSDGERWVEVRCDALRHEMRYIYLEEKSRKAKEKKIVELVRKLPHPMIIYCARPDEAERIRVLLGENGIRNVRTYTGLTDGSQREQILREWKADQFSVMAATSAFGVGVDKPDVRTVLHTYIPQNPNSYYQEAGRGGRDHLPSLSVICTQPDDIHSTYQRISKRVMTTEKIIGRWNSMYNNKSSIRDGVFTHINTAIRPDYSLTEEMEGMDDVPVSEADRNWNIYVLLLFRRYDLIDIVSITNERGVYIFSIKIKEPLLLQEGAEQEELLDGIRTKEAKHYNDACKTMEQAIRQRKTVCWSEMFYDTYDKVDEYCAGCNAHTDINHGDAHVFALKKAILQPEKVVRPDQKKLFASLDELLVIAKNEERVQVIQYLEQQGLSCLVASEQQLEKMKYFLYIHTEKPTFIIDPAGARDLLKKRNYYYISGMVAVLYPDEGKEALEYYRLADRYLCQKAGIHLVHIVARNFFFAVFDKKMGDLVPGGVVAAGSLIGR